MNTDAPYVRPSRPADRDDLACLVAATRRTDPVYAAAIGPSVDAAMAWLGTPGPGRRWVVEQSGRVVGTVEVSQARLPGDPERRSAAAGEADSAWELRRLLVHPDHQRCGLGAALVAAARAWVEDQGDQVWLSCRAPLVPFYERLGWRAGGELTFTSTGLPGSWMAPR